MPVPSPVAIDMTVDVAAPAEPGEAALEAFQGRIDLIRPKPSIDLPETRSRRAHAAR